jgi:hypothetical protein
VDNGLRGRKGKREDGMRGWCVGGMFGVAYMRDGVGRWHRGCVEEWKLLLFDKGLVNRVLRSTLGDECQGISLELLVNC